MTTTIGNWNLLLANKVVFLTGGAGYIAKHIAQTCYMHGAYVVLGDLNIETINKVKDDILTSNNNSEDRILTVSLDVTDEKSIEQAVKLTIEKWKTIDVLFNTAAIFPMRDVEHASSDDWSQVFDINVRGYALMAKHILPILKKQRSGSIVNIASIGGMVAFGPSVLYSTSKSAIIQMTRNLAVDLGPFNVRVNSVSPGYVDSDTIRRIAQDINMNTNQLEDKATNSSCLKRMCHPQEIANMMVFLASDLCPFMTGTNVVIDGGYTAV